MGLLTLLRQQLSSWLDLVPLPYVPFVAFPGRLVRLSCAWSESGCKPIPGSLSSFPTFATKEGTMWNRNSTRIGLLLAGVLLFSQAPVRSSATASEGDQVAQGWLTFLEVLAGDQTKLQLALSQLEKAANQDPTNQQNLFTLGRAYFYDAITHYNLASAEKSERIFARVLELNPKHDALAFHGSVLTILSQGKDLAKFRRGVEEMNQVVQQNPSSLNGRLSRSLTALALPPQARSGMGK